jgi:hypothetical protein
VYLVGLILVSSGAKEDATANRVWLYYAFSSAVVLFLDVIRNPLHSEATLNLALISI